MIAKYGWRGVIRSKLWVFAIALGLCSIAIPNFARADLLEYVKKPDSAFAWSQTGKK